MDTSTSMGNRELAVAKKRALDAAYFRKGIAVAALSSCMYALYTVSSLAFGPVGSMHLLPPAFWRYSSCPQSPRASMTC